MTATTSPPPPPSGSWDYDIDRDVIRCDAHWYRILGLDPVAEPITCLADFRRHIHPEDVDLATSVDLDDVDRLLAIDAPYHRDFRIVRPDGEVRWLRSVACLVRNNGDRRAVGCATDITDYRAARDGAAGAGAAASLLSEREHECLGWVTQGKTAWETAAIIGLSPRTVEFHLANATRKLGAGNKVHAATLAIRQGLI